MINLKQDLHLAYILHARPYRETSLLLEIFSAEHGRVAAVARGAKRGKAKISSILQPFIPLQVSWYGGGELVTLTAAEIGHLTAPLVGKNAICGLYINELVTKLLPKWDHCADLFTTYAASIANLASGDLSAQVVLRKFELQLLKSLGYALQLSQEVETGASIRADAYYVFDPVLGPKITHSSNVAAFKGASLLALAAGCFTAPEIMLDLKRLMRLVLRHHLGGRQLVSRELL